MLQSLAKAVVNVLLVLLMAVLTLPALFLIWVASIPLGYLKKQMPPGLTKAQVDSLRDQARLRQSGEHYAGGL